MKAKIRKIATFLEETHSEMGRAVTPPTRRAAAVAVIENPFAGKYVEDLTDLMLVGEELGELLTQRAVAALDIDPTTAESYGKAAAVGENGELEHAAATIIANAVDLPGHPAITRVPACSLAPDNDLGSRLVTQAVGDLTQDEIATALEAGSRTARELLNDDLIRSAALHLSGETRIVPERTQLAAVVSQIQESRSFLHA